MTDRYQVPVTETGRMTMPAAIRRELGLVEGGQLVFTRTPDGRFEIASLQQSSPSIA